MKYRYRLFLAKDVTRRMHICMLLTPWFALVDWLIKIPAMYVQSGDQPNYDMYIFPPLFPA